MKADIYRNLHKKCMSIRSRDKGTYGRVTAYANVVLMNDCKFVVNERGRLKVVATKRKNVHAFVRGLVTYYGWTLAKSLEDLGTLGWGVDGWTPVAYNPYIFTKFVYGELNCPALTAREVLIVNNKVYAKGINSGV